MRRCARCGGPTTLLLDHSYDIDPSPAGFPVLDDWAAARWLHAYEAAWIGEDWTRVERCLAPDVRFLPWGETVALMGREAVVANMRQRAKQLRMHEYNATDVAGSSSGPVGVIDYRWQLDCTQGLQPIATTGRDVLVLRAAADDWELVWCAQLLL